MTITNDEWRKANLVTGEALAELDIDYIPINIFNIIQNKTPLNIYTYQEFSKITNYPIKDVKKMTRSDEGGLVLIGYEYYILYNDLGPASINHLRFTLAHELGHYYLEHILEEDKNDRYGDYEKLAGIFAADFLVPPALVLDRYNFPINEEDKYNVEMDLQKTFEVSRDVAHRIIERFNSAKFLRSFWESYLHADIVYKPRIDYSQYIPTYGDGLLASNNKLKFAYCSVCHALNSALSGKVRYCAVCGSENIHVRNYSFKFHETEEQEVIEYKKFDVAGKPSHLGGECPKCGNTIDYQSNFCEVCGLFLINRCTGQAESNFYKDFRTNEFLRLSKRNPFKDEMDETELDPKNLFSNENFKTDCEYACSGKARYCAKCGSVTTFYIQNLFDDWTEEKISAEVEINMPF